MSDEKDMNEGHTKQKNGKKHTKNSSEFWKKYGRLI